MAIDHVRERAPRPIRANAAESGATPQGVKSAPAAQTLEAVQATHATVTSTTDGFAKSRGAASRPAPSTALGALGMLALRASSSSEAPLARLLTLGIAVEAPALDYAREGTFTVPTAPNYAVKTRSLLSLPRDQLVETLRGPLAIHPKSGPAHAHDGVRIFVPGLNTPEPEASRRTALYADKLTLSLAHLHNGTGSSLGDLKPIPGREDVVLPADKRDWAEAVLVRQGLMESRLKGPIADVIVRALEAIPPVPVSLALYSDSTIGGVQGVALAKERLIAAQLDDDDPVSRAAATKEVEDLLRAHLFVELHGNGCASLPNGPRYLVWTDRGDPLTTKESPLSGSVGVFGGRPDPSAKNVVYVDYEGPYSDRGFNAHNLGASGIHAIRAVLDENGVRTPEALHALVDGGAELVMPDARSLVGDESELW